MPGPQDAAGGIPGWVASLWLWGSPPHSLGCLLDAGVQVAPAAHISSPKALGGHSDIHGHRASHGAEASYHMHSRQGSVGGRRPAGTTGDTEHIQGPGARTGLPGVVCSVLPGVSSSLDELWEPAGRGHMLEARTRTQAFPPARIMGHIHLNQLHRTKTCQGRGQQRSMAPHHPQGEECGKSRLNQ